MLPPFTNCYSGIRHTAIYTVIVAHIASRHHTNRCTTCTPHITSSPAHTALTRPPTQRAISPFSAHVWSSNALLFSKHSCSYRTVIQCSRYYQKLTMPPPYTFPGHDAMAQPIGVHILTKVPLNNMALQHNVMCWLYIKLCHIITSVYTSYTL